MALMVQKGLHMFDIGSDKESQKRKLEEISEKLS